MTACDFKAAHQNQFIIQNETGKERREVKRLELPHE